MLSTSLLVFSLLFQSILGASDVGLNTVEIIENHGYVAETHEVVTEDGYIVTLHRIPHGIDGTPTTKVALLMHGFTSSSSDFVNMGPGISLSYFLADAGYDVWMGNARGNAYSRNHTSIDVVANPEQFFDFSWHEIGYYDLAAFIDYILEKTQEESLYYVGHSQGCTTYLVLASSRPAYNSKIRVSSLLAPSAFCENKPPSILSVISQYIETVQLLLQRYQIYEVPYTNDIREWAMVNCVDEEHMEDCITMFSSMGFDLDKEQVDYDMIPVIGTNDPSNAAMKQLVHYCQLTKYGGFSMYDYGTDQNLELYGSERPPQYNLSQISTPVALYYAKNDQDVNIRDVLLLRDKLPNVANDYLVPFEPYNHLDFVFAKQNIDLVYNELLSVMEKY